MKICYKCKETKELEKFYRNNSSKDGKQGKCISCIKAWDLAHKKTNRTNHNFSDFNLHKFILDKYSAGTSIKNIAKSERISTHLIVKILKFNKIEIKDSNRRRKYKILNENYFDSIDSEEKAYFLGFLWADGCNYRKNIKGKCAHQIIIALKEEDKSILSKFAIMIYGDDKILQFRNRKKHNRDGCKRQNQWVLRIPSKKISDALLNIGMTERKSLTVEWPKILPTQLIVHFIRGVYDGDGGISFNNNSLSYMVEIIGSIKFMDYLYKYLEGKFTTNFCISLEKKKSAYMKRLRIHGNKKCRTFLDWLYEDSTIKLDRKYLRYLDLCRLSKTS